MFASSLLLCRFFFLMKMKAANRAMSARPHTPPTTPPTMAPTCESDPPAAGALLVVETDAPGGGVRGDSGVTVETFTFVTSASTVYPTVKICSVRKHWPGGIHGASDQDIAFSCTLAARGCALKIRQSKVSPQSVFMLRSSFLQSEPIISAV